MHVKNEIISELEIECGGDRSIILTQGIGGSLNRIVLHSIHIRHIAEIGGALDSPNQLEGLHARTKRALRRLSERVITFRDYFARYADFDHADLNDEMVQLNSLHDLAVDGLEDLGHDDLIATLAESEDAPEPPPKPKQQKLDVAHPGKAVPASFSALQKSLL